MSPCGLSRGDGGGTGGSGLSRGDGGGTGGSGLSGGDGGGTGGGCNLTTAFEIARPVAKCVAYKTKAMTQSALHISFSYFKLFSIEKAVGRL